MTRMTVIGSVKAALCEAVLERYLRELHLGIWRQECASRSFLDAIDGNHRSGYRRIGGIEVGD